MSTWLSGRETRKSIVLDLAQHSTLLLGLVRSPPSEWWIVLFALIDWHGFKRTFYCRNAVMVREYRFAWPVRESRSNHEGSLQLSGFAAYLTSLLVHVIIHEQIRKSMKCNAMKCQVTLNKVMNFYFQLNSVDWALAQLFKLHCLSAIWLNMRL